MVQLAYLIFSKSSWSTEEGSFGLLKSPFDRKLGKKGKFVRYTYVGKSMTIKL